MASEVTFDLRFEISDPQNHYIGWYMVDLLIKLGTCPEKTWNICLFVDCVSLRNAVNINNKYNLLEKEYGVDDSLADYMTSVLDIGYPQQFNTMTNDIAYGTDFDLEQKQAETGLRRVLTENNFDLLELFEALAVR